MGTRDQIKKLLIGKQKKVAVFIVNYNMNERAEALYDYLRKNETWPIDIYLIDNGSDITQPSKKTNVFIKDNVQTTNGWLQGLAQSDKKYFNYFAYLFLITSTEFVKQTKKPVSSMIQKLLEDDNAIGVHASLTEDSTTYWNHLKNRGSKEHFRQTFFIDNICSLYRADWFNGIGRFDKELTYAWGIDVETCYLGRKQGRTIWIDESIQVRKEKNVGYKMKRMNMTSNERERLAQENMDLVLGKKYGPDYWRIMNTEYVTDQMR